MFYTISDFHTKCSHFTHEMIYETIATLRNDFFFYHKLQDLPHQSGLGKKRKGTICTGYTSNMLWLGNTSHTKSGISSQQFLKK